MVVCPEPTGGKVLNLTDRVEQIVAQPVIANGSVVTLKIGILLGLARLGINKLNRMLSAPLSEHARQHFRPIIDLDPTRNASGAAELLQRSDHSGSRY